MPIHHAVLGMLARGPSYGYELKGAFEQTIGPQWGELNIGHLHQVLDRLIRDGLVTRREVPQRDRPDKMVYRLTKRGRTELDRWLGEPFVRGSGYRDDFFLKLLAASQIGPERFRQVCRVQREAYLAELAALAKLQAEYRADPLVALLIQAAAFQTEASLKVAEAAEDRAEEMAVGPTMPKATSATIPRKESGASAGRLRGASG